ncbi:MAG: c-type cytochrome [Bdellovibrionota bacterium]|jgi:mono/diheme cytochrome c family protein
MIKIKSVLCWMVLASVISSCSPNPEPINVGVPQDQAYLTRGRELVKGLASCGLCHGASPDPQSPLIGGRTFKDRYGAVNAPNLTPDKTGLADWSAVEIITAIRSSIGKNGEELSEEMHEGYEWISDQDALAIVAYLKALPPVENKVERRKLNWWQRNITGMFESREVQSGFVPAIDPKYKAEYGKYLTEHVARVEQCLMPKEEESPWYSFILGGGKSTDGAAEKRFKDWSVDEIVYFLQTGESPTTKGGDRYLDAGTCPVKFYRNAAEADLNAMATYLKSR